MLMVIGPSELLALISTVSPAPLATGFGKGAEVDEVIGGWGDVAECVDVMARMGRLMATHDPTIPATKRVAASGTT